MTKETKAKITTAADTYYQKVMVLIMTILIGYIATVAGGVKTDIEVLKNNTEHLVGKVNEHSNKLSSNNDTIHKHDTRLVRIESKLKIGG